MADHGRGQGEGQNRAVLSISSAYPLASRHGGNCGEKSWSDEILQFLVTRQIMPGYGQGGYGEGPYGGTDTNAEAYQNQTVAMFAANISKPRDCNSRGPSETGDQR